jgi:pyridoxal phosphate enzyme (YggS family)
MGDIRTRLSAIREAIDRASAAAGRTDVVTLVAVSKTVDGERILEAYAAGQRVFGENRVQEGAAKIERLRSTAPGAHWHLLGHLQTNKVRPAVEHFSFVESVDSLRIADKLNAAAEAIGQRLPVLLEVNVGGEESKGGFEIDLFRASIPHLIRLPNLELRGLMTVAPLASDPEDVSWVFRRLRELRDGVRDRFELPRFTDLSMGMTNDFEVAVREGATMVRIGRAIFGDRAGK